MKRKTGVAHYNSKGELIATYKTIVEAAKTTGYCKTMICDCCNNKRDSVHKEKFKHIYDYRSPYKKINWEYKKPKSIIHKIDGRTSIAQYDSKGNYVATYKSVKEAAEKSNEENGRRIRYSLDKGVKTKSGNYWVWIKEGERPKRKYTNE